MLKSLPIILFLYSQKLCPLFFSIILKLFSINNIIKIILNLFCSYTATFHLVECSLPKADSRLDEKELDRIENTLSTSSTFLECYVQLYSRVTFSEACLNMKTTMHMVGPR